MQLFISYSRDDKAWVYEFWQALSAESEHQIWIDRRLVPAQDWWHTILENIETCQCFIYVMTPKSVASIYCQAELNYALTLKKPVLPIMLKPCELPQILSEKRFQYETMTDDMTMDRLLLRVISGLCKVELKLLKEPPQEVKVKRPDLPVPGNNPEQLSEVFLLAEEQFADQHYAEAEKLFQQVIAANPAGLGRVALKRLEALCVEKARHESYSNVVRLAQSANMKKAALEYARNFIEDYGLEYDPDGVLASLLNVNQPAAPISTSTSPRSTTKVKIAPSHEAQQKPQALSPREVLPGPFEWIVIPAGKVKLITRNGWPPNYIHDAEGQAFEVEAFTIGKYPVTNAQFAEFVKADGYKQLSWWTTEGWRWCQSEGWQHPKFWEQPGWDKPDYPVAGVSWFEALAFSRWLSDITHVPIQLPTETQWQRAAQGDDNRSYPWGNEYSKAACNFESKGITPVMQYEGKGNSPFGVVDLCGNIQEWCLTNFEDGTNDPTRKAQYRVLRGGAWEYVNEYMVRADWRVWREPSFRENVGFRIASRSDAK